VPLPSVTEFRSHRISNFLVTEFLGLACASGHPMLDIPSLVRPL